VFTGCVVGFRVDRKATKCEQRCLSKVRIPDLDFSCPTMCCSLISSDSALDLPFSAQMLKPGRLNRGGAPTIRPLYVRETMATRWC
jgi:hypothetical protein